MPKNKSITAKGKLEGLIRKMSHGVYLDLDALAVAVGCKRAWVRASLQELHLNNLLVRPSTVGWMRIKDHVDKQHG
jgi:hypothetical protein